jgi:hypothetical protein
VLWLVPLEDSESTSPGQAPIRRTQPLLVEDCYPASLLGHSNHLCCSLSPAQNVISGSPLRESAPEAGRHEEAPRTKIDLGVDLLSGALTHSWHVMPNMT